MKQITFSKISSDYLILNISAALFLIFYKWLFLLLVANTNLIIAFHSLFGESLVIFCQFKICNFVFTTHFDQNDFAFKCQTLLVSYLAIVILHISTFKTLYSSISFYEIKSTLSRNNI
ncbi:hypothetical protein Anas_10369 [Armadillidium nasatum]|uniref:Uncharacterized protein n=1 Tax=Armadillidium nasatum TaxID=96803 RepID=A0A5N5SQU2_9CRUS|nr:hypothetical protein Anas_10369 [Armadillidium nasatum]